MKLLKYNHASATKYSLNKTYELEELKKELSLEKIKILFQPINFEWKDLEVKKKVQKVQEETI
jgi:hypothetical protein